MAEQYPIPIADGIDQRASAVVGQFRIQRLERARYLQPGEVIVSPGYAYDSGAISPAGRTLRAVGYSPRFGAWAVYSGLLSNGYFCAALARKGHSGAWTIDEANTISGVEAPRRIRIDTNDATAATTVLPQLLPTTDPSLLLVVTNGYRVNYLFNGQVTKSIDFPGRSGDDGSMLRAAGRILFDKVGSLWSYDLTSDTFTRHLSLSGTFDYITGAFSTGNFGRAGLAGFAATAHTTGKIRVFAWDGSNYSLLGTIAAATLPDVIANVHDIAVAFVGTVIVRSCFKGATLPYQTLSFRSFSISTLASGTEFPYTVTSPDTLGDTCSMVADASGALWVAFAERSNHVSATSVNTVTIAGGNVTGLVSKSTITHRSFAGVIAPAPATHGVLLLTTAGNIELWGVDVAHPGSTNATGTATLLTSWGLGDATTGRSQPARIATRSAFDGKVTESILFGNWGTLNSVAKANEITSVELGALYGWADNFPSSGATLTATQVSPTESFQRASDFVGGGSPFAIGTRIDTAGCNYVIPAPSLEAAVAGPHADSGFMTAGTYVYALTLEAYNSSGERLRSAPSLPATITLTTETAVHMYFPKLPPMLPGMTGARWVVYRTASNGSVFYNDSLGSYQSNYSDVSYTDKLSDSDIASREIMYTQGATGGLSGQKPNYGVPPCRCLWRGRDRLIAGGLELPRRVRWSKLFYPGEVVQFPHPAELAWTTDVDDDVSAVAQLDDAWLVLCANSIFAIYGQGPEDTGGNGQFDPPRCISRTIGCHSPRSLCEIPEGLLFQAQDGVIYLIVRGTTQVVPFSEKIRNILTDISTGVAMGWVSAVVRHETRGTIHFVRDTSAPIVYNVVTQSWTTDSDDVSEGLTGAISACAARIPAATRTETNSASMFPTVLFATSTGKILFEGCGNGTVITTGPDGTVLWTPLLESNSMALWGLMGWGSVPKVSLLFGAGYGETVFPLNQEAKLTTWGGDEPYKYFPQDLSILSQSFGDSKDYQTNSTKLRNPRAASYRLRVEWATQKFAGFGLDVEKKPGAERNQGFERA